MHTRTCLLALLLGATAVPALAATLIEGKDEGGEYHRIMIQDDWARLEYGEGEPAEYLLLNLKNNQAYAVDRGQRQVVEMSEASAPPRGVENKTPAAHANVSFKKKGAGPKIAGYATEQYVLSAGGALCGEHFVAPQTLQSGDVKRFIQAMLQFSQGQAASDEDPLREPCTAAEDMADSEYGKLGLPLRVTDAEGKVVHEIEKISTVAAFPASKFEIPAGYAVTNPKQMMEEMMRDMPSPDSHSSMPMDEETLQKMRQHMEEMRHRIPDEDSETAPE